MSTTTLHTASRLSPVLARAQVPAAAAALLLSAFLLFSVQPMFTKMVLPSLGGSPATWSVALVVFQALLLGGYLYAHLLARWLGTRTALALHLGLMLVAGLALPIGLPAGWGHPPAENQALWLVGLFVTAVGLPFFALSANGPLLQAWFARSGHARAGDPYFLYAASNIGSFAALVAYPVLIEPVLPLRVQAETWLGGFVLLALLILASGLASSAAPAGAARGVRASTSAAPSWHRRGAWIGLALVPSALLVSVTAHISTDVAAAPFLWVIPLALFLLTFVLAFRDGMGLPGPVLLRLQVWGTALALASSVVGFGLWGGLALHLGLFFVSALICHATLYHLRPAPDRLTEFYVCVSLGGVLGGIACGLVAPLVFSRVVEYPLLIVAALACRPGFFSGSARAWLAEAGPSALAGVAAAVIMILAGALLDVAALPQLLVLAGAGLLAASWRNPQRLAAGGVLALVACLVH